MVKVLVFAILSIPIVIISFRSLKVPGSHGFYRFFGWEGLLWLAVSNFSYWFEQPFSLLQIISWILLFYSLYLVIAGVLLLMQKGKAHHSRQDQTLFSFEKTTELVETGVFRYIRHPLYGSLTFLTWGIFLKQPTWWFLLVTLFSSLMFFLTAKRDEKECIAYFGEAYKDYMKRTKMFIPYIF
jgi:protein-S-isoprenylcysteine O-methyltransferase Ste14